MNTEHRPFLPSFLQSKGPPLSPLSITTQGPLLSHSLRPYLLSSPPCRSSALDSLPLPPSLFVYYLWTLFRLNSNCPSTKP